MKNSIKTIFFLFLIYLISLEIQGQSGNVTNINLPSPTLGVFPEDMIYANGMLFIYSTSGIVVYDENSGDWISTIALLDEQPIGQSYIYMSLLAETRTAYNLMAYDEANTIYAVAPDYSVWSIDVSSNPPVHIARVIPSCYAGKYLTGSIKLKYDPNSHWLFYAAQGPNEGEPSALRQYFGIYDTQSYFTLIDYFEEPPRLYPDIYDILIDYQTDTKSYFYLSRKLKIQIFEFNITTKDVYEKVTITTDNQFKHGKLVRIVGN
jgi:hypothetical protein